MIGMLIRVAIEPIVKEVAARLVDDLAQKTEAKINQLNKEITQLSEDTGQEIDFIKRMIEREDAWLKNK